MDIITQTQLIDFTDEEVNKFLLGNAFTFELLSQEHGSTDLAFSGEIIDYTTSSKNNLIFSLKVSLDNGETLDVKILNILNLTTIPYNEH